jgi:hypothetical protein
MCTNLYGGVEEFGTTKWGHSITQEWAVKYSVLSIIWANGGEGDAQIIEKHR